MPVKVMMRSRKDDHTQRDRVAKASYRTPRHAWAIVKAFERCAGVEFRLFMKNAISRIASRAIT